jgi:exopolysaccharide production protein ExoQ
VLVTLAVRAFLFAPRSRKVLSLAVGAWIACAALVVAGGSLGPSLRAAAAAPRPDSRIETLSGRAALWDELLGYARERPLLGYGLGSFWSPERLEAVYASQRWPVAHAHSSYLEAALELGALGLTLFAALTVAAVTRAARTLATSSLEA